MTWIRICIVGHLLDLRTQEANYSFRPILRSLDPSPQYNLCGSSSMIKKLNFCPSVKFFLPIFMKIQIQVAENRIQFGSRSTGRPQVYRNWFDWLVVCVFAGKCTPPPLPPFPLARFWRIFLSSQKSGIVGDRETERLTGGGGMGGRVQ